MTEKVIPIEGVDLLDFYGVANSNFNRICDLFPKLKIVARGNAIKVMGSEEEIGRLEERLRALELYYNKYGHLSVSVVNQIFQGGLPHADNQPVDADVIVYGNNGLIVKARTKNQQKLVELYKQNDLLFAVGPAGSGKTYCAIALAVRALKNREVKRIILSRPAVEAGEKLGFLPGDMKEKIDPYLQPLYDALQDMIPGAKLNEYMERGVIQIAPLAFMRGRTLADAIVILDEAQNTTTAQLKMFLTRLGVNGKMIITGDLTQIDLPASQKSGLKDAIERLQDIRGIAMVEFTQKDIVRHHLVQRIVDAYASHSKNEE
jgi:phosphate starvation-inducible PhoH-like protein